MSGSQPLFSITAKFRVRVVYRWRFNIRVYFLNSIDSRSARAWNRSQFRCFSQTCIHAPTRDGPDCLLMEGLEVRILPEERRKLLSSAPSSQGFSVSPPPAALSVYCAPDVCRSFRAPNEDRIGDHLRMDLSDSLGGQRGNGLYDRRSGSRRNAAPSSTGGATQARSNSVSRQPLSGDSFGLKAGLKET